MVELLIVVSIIAVLASMTMGVITLLQKKARKFETTNLMTQLGLAVTAYLEKNGVLGEGSAADFRAAPCEYLIHRSSRTVEGKSIEIPCAEISA